MIIIPQTMQNKAMRAIIDYYQTYPTHIIGKDFLIHKQICNESEVKHLIDVLCSKKLITYVHEDDMQVIRLTPHGKIYFEEKAEIAHKKRIEGIRYWIPIIISNTIAITALIVSILRY